MEQVKNTIEKKEITPLEQIQQDLNSPFPFAALWQDGEVPNGLKGLIPVIHLVVTIIMFILMIFILVKK